jgi:hypothetical protein
MAEQTVAECLTAATDSVTVITDINTNGKKSTYVGGSAEADTDMSQADINETVQRNVDHLELILEYTEPDVKGASDDKSSYTGAITTGKAYIAAN